MKRIARPLIGLACALQLSCGRTEPTVGGPASSDLTTAAICTSKGKLDLSAVRVLRSAITSPEASRGTLIELASKVADGSKSCASSLDGVNATVLGSLHTLLGDRLLDSKEHRLAIDEYNAAAAMFERASVPDIMWLRALEGKAEAEVATGRIEDAKETASRETSIARSWAGDSGKRFMLIQALRAEARICLAARLPERANELRAEAEKLESLPR